MFCMECGKKIPDNGKFCICCGASIVFECDMEEDMIGVSDDNTLIVEEESIENSFLREYVIAKDTKVIGNLLNGKKLEHYKDKYLCDKVYRFPIKNDYVEYPEHIVMLINAAYFFRVLRERVGAGFIQKYLERVTDMESFYGEGLPLYHTTHKDISEATVQFLVASGIMTVSVDEVNDCIPQMHKELNSNLNQLFSLADKIVSQVKTDMDIREMNNMIAANNGYSAGGFGFSGVMGGIAAAGLMNAGSGAIRKIRDEIANSRDKKRLQNALDELFTNEAIIEEFLNDLLKTIEDAYCVYCEKVEEEKGVRFDYLIEQESYNRAENTMKYMSDNEELLVENLCKALSNIYEYKDALKYLVKYFYQDKKTLGEITELTDFLLFSDELQEWLKEAEEEAKVQWEREQEEKRKELNFVFDMSEQTSRDILKKMKKLEEEAERISFDASEDMSRLRTLLKKVLEVEKREPLNKAFALPENTIEEIDCKLSKMEEEATRIGCDVSNELAKLKKKRQDKVKEKKESDYRWALSLPENSVEEIDRKMVRVAEEAKKIGYDSNDNIQCLKKKKEDILNSIKEAERDEVRESIWEIVSESSRKRFAEKHISEFLHGLLVCRSEAEFEKDTEWQETLMNVYGKSVELLENEMPLVFYDDTLTENGNDSFTITTERLISSYMGKVEEISLAKISSYVLVEKLFAASVLINNEQKLSMVLAGKKNVAGMAEGVQIAVEAAKIIHNTLMEEDINVLKSIYEQLISEKNQVQPMDNLKEELEELSKYIIDNYYPQNKVEAVEYYRECTGESLKEAKEYIDKLFQGVNIEQSEKSMENKMIFCTTCGKKIKYSSKFCNFCGMPNTYGDRSVIKFETKR